MEKTVKPGSTLFVRNLPFSATSEKLESAFSDIGPIKKCFVVKEKGSDKCRGFGYVTFSLKDDAEKAKDQLKTFDGRKIFVHYADKKPKVKRGRKDENDKGDTKEADDDSDDTDTEGPTKPAPATSPKEKSSPKGKTSNEKNMRPSCVVVISNLTDTTQKSDLEEVVKGLKNSSSLTYPVPDRDSSVAHVSFMSKRDSLRATRKLASIKVNGNQVKALLLSQDATTRSQKYLKRCRLIIRNLSFKCDTTKLQESFNKFGEITDVKIPTKPNGKKIGCGFVQFTNLGDANRALQAMNTKAILDRKVAVDWAVPKSKFIEATNKDQDDGSGSDDSGSFSKESENDSDSDLEDEPPTKPPAITTPRQHTSDSDSDSDSESETETNDKKDPGSDESDDENETEEEEEEEDEDEVEEEEEAVETKVAAVDESADEESDDDDLQAATKRKIESSDEEDDDDVDDDDDEMDSNSDSDLEPVKKKQKTSVKSDVDEGKTLFIRNVSYDSIEEDLEEAFSKFGELNYCRMVIDRNTEHPKGTAFVQYKDIEDAEKCMQQANDEGRHGGMTVDGRQLNVTLAVGRDQAVKLVQKAKEKTPKDNRNLHLAREGLIRPGTQDAEGLSKPDLDKRTKVEQLKRQKLKNPQIFVSTSRLCVRNLPTNVTDAQLRKVMLKSSGDKKAKINECRIMRDMNRMNAQGVAKSMGFAFVNFTEHQHALAALRGSNNNPELFGEKKKLIVEFSLENRTALNIKEKRLQRAQAKQEVLKKGSTYGQVRGLAKKEKAPPSALLDEEEGGARKLKKGEKALPTHWGAKVRHKPRPSQIKVAQKPKDKRSRKDKAEGKQEPGNKMEVVSPALAKEKPTKKKRKGRKKAVPTDNLDKLVDQYRQKFSSKSFSQNMSKKKEKWFK